MASSHASATRASLPAAGKYFSPCMLMFAPLSHPLIRFSSAPLSHSLFPLITAGTWSRSFIHINGEVLDVYVHFLNL